MPHTDPQGGVCCVDRDCTLLVRIGTQHPIGMLCGTRRILEVGKKLEQYPETGAALQGVGADAYRQIMVGQYRVIHRVDLDAVRIARVYHGARLLRRSDLDR